MLGWQGAAVLSWRAAVVDYAAVLGGWEEEDEAMAIRLMMDG